MIRKIVSIDEEKCTGCGLCAQACHEGAIAMVDGKARLVRDDYCDGMGDCLPHCPADAIRITEREAVAYDEEAVAAHKKEGGSEHASSRPAVPHEDRPGGCPGSRIASFNRDAAAGRMAPQASTAGEQPSQLRQWPVQVKLAPVKAPYFDGAHLLVAADCTAYAYGAFHRDFIRGKITLIGCPKLDAVDYTDKLEAILKANDIRSLTIVRMEVPCCGGIEQAAREALRRSGRFIPWRVVTVSIDGRLLDA